MSVCPSPFCHSGAELTQYFLHEVLKFNKLVLSSSMLSFSLLFLPSPPLLLFFLPLPSPPLPSLSLPPLLLLSPPLPQASTHILGSEELGRTRSQTRKRSESGEEKDKKSPMKRSSTMAQTAKVHTELTSNYALSEFSSLFPYILLLSPNYEIFEYIVSLHSLSNTNHCLFNVIKRRKHIELVANNLHLNPLNTTHLLQVCNCRLDDPVYHIHSFLAGRGGVSRT